MQKDNEYTAITRCFQAGVYLSRNKFSAYIKEYNNFEKPISERIKAVAREEDLNFISFVKLKENIS